MLAGKGALLRPQELLAPAAHDRGSPGSGHQRHPLSTDPRKLQPQVALDDEGHAEPEQTLDAPLGGCVRQIVRDDPKISANFDGKLEGKFEPPANSQ